MGFFKSKQPSVPAGPSAAEIAEEERLTQQQQALAGIQEQESARQKLRAQLSAQDEEEGAITRKRLFGE